MYKKNSAVLVPQYILKNNRVRTVFFPTEFGSATFFTTKCQLPFAVYRVLPCPSATVLYVNVQKVATA